MKAILEFNLPEENQEHELAVKSVKLAVAIEDILNDVFRKKLKYGNFSNNVELEKLHQQHPDIVMEVIEQLKAETIAVLENNGVLDLIL